MMTEGTAKVAKCPVCKGSGQITVTVCEWGKKGTESAMDCLECKGSGKVTPTAVRRHKAEMALWCRCEKPSDDIIFHDDGECRQCSKHHYHCGSCGKITQVG